MIHDEAMRFVCAYGADWQNVELAAAQIERWSNDCRQKRAAFAFWQHLSELQPERAGVNRCFALKLLHALDSYEQIAQNREFKHGGRDSITANGKQRRHPTTIMGLLNDLLRLDEPPMLIVNAGTDTTYFRNWSVAEDGNVLLEHQPSTGEILLAIPLRAIRKIRLRYERKASGKKEKSSPAKG